MIGAQDVADQPPAIVYEDLPPLPQMRALALRHPKGAELAFDSIALAGAYAAFLREEPLISAKLFAQLWFELGERWGGEMGLQFGALLAEDWDRVRRAALAMRRPRAADATIQ